MSFLYPDVKLISFVMDMKAQLDTVVYHQQAILQELTKTRIKNTPQLPTGIMLPLQTFEQTQSLERKLQVSSTEKQGLVCVHFTFEGRFFSGRVRPNVMHIEIYLYQRFVCHFIKQLLTYLLTYARVVSNPIIVFIL